MCAIKLSQHSLPLDLYELWVQNASLGHLHANFFHRVASAGFPCAIQGSNKEAHEIASSLGFPNRFQLPVKTKDSRSEHASSETRQLFILGTDF